MTIAPNLKTPSARLRLWLVAGLFALAFLALVVQLVRWQLVDRSRILPEEANLTASAQQRGPQRGMIVDRTGEPLAMDAYRWEIWVEPKLVPEADAARLAADLSTALGPELLPDPSRLVEIFATEQTTPTVLTRHAPQPVGEAIATWEWPKGRGVGTAAVPVRVYPQRSLGAHLVGFVNDEPRAYYGVEQYYEDYLRMVEAPFFRAEASTLAAYQQLAPALQNVLPSPVGQDLILTVDRRIQYMLHRELAEALGEYGAESGTIIVMNPHTGAILGMVSLPTYDPNRYAQAKPEVLADPAISKQYEPGSVFKIVTVASGLDAGVITPSTTFTDTESLEVGGRTIFNWDRLGRGSLTVREALVASRNIPMARVALELGSSVFYQYVRRFGFGQLTEVDLANEGPGTVKVPGDPLWSSSDLATNAFGQGLAVTPLQMATATAVIANGGLLVRPHVVDSMMFRGRMISPDKTPVRRVIQPETASTLKDMMVDVVEEGATAARVLDYAVAGKTGTAQVPIQGGYHPTQTIASFVGFAPADDPQFVVLVKLDKPKTFSWAVNTAAPTFSEVVNELVYLLNVPPTRTASRP